MVLICRERHASVFHLGSLAGVEILHSLTVIEHTIEINCGAPSGLSFISIFSPRSLYLNAVCTSNVSYLPVEITGFSLLIFPRRLK